MAKLTLDLSGIGGLLERHQGDLNDTTIKPHLRYIGGDNQMADGYFNPLKKYGYMSPAVDAFKALTGTIAAGINSIQYDPSSDVVYMSEAGENILKLDGMDDTSLANYLSITAGYDIKDMVIYEVNGQKSLVYVIDSNLPLVIAYNGTLTDSNGGMFLGFKTIDTTDGATVLEKDLRAVFSTVEEYELLLGDVSSYSRGTIGRKLGQEFDGGDVRGRAISGVELSLRRSAGTGAGITMKVSIQANSSASTGAFTSRGAWSNAITNYVINDTVTNGGSTWQCILAHDAAATANDEPGVGSNYETYWNYFGAPDGTVLASQTFSLSDVPVLVAFGERRYTLEFTTPVTGLGSGNYWIVIEEVGSNMTASDKLAVLTSINNSGIYDGYKLKQFADAATDYWIDIMGNGDNGLDTMDFRLIMNRDDFWTQNLGSTSNLEMIQNAFGVESGQGSYVYLADNGLLYWVVGNKIHTIDGSITGAGTGFANENVIQFSSYVTIPDIAETRSRMYIAVQTSNITTATDPRNYGANKIGVYIWDRRSQIQGGTDFYPCPGAKEIKSLFTSSDGSVKAITVGNSGFTEIRGVSGNQFAVLQTLEKDGYPATRRSITMIDQISVWLGANGIIYGYGSMVPGEKEALYKLGSMASTGGTTPVYGPIISANEYSTSPRLALLLAHTNATPSYNVKKWYPNGEGTIESVVQIALIGDIFSPVKYLPEMSTATDLTIYCAPTASSGSTVIATVKIYFNQSSTVGMTKSVTQAEAARGYVHWSLNKHNVNAIQLEIEHNITDALGSNEFLPSIAILEYEPTKTHTADRG